MSDRNEAVPLTPGMRRLLQSLEGGPLESVVEAREVLREAGKDPEVVAREGLAFVRAQLAKARLRRAGEERQRAERTLDDMRGRLQQQLKTDRDALLGRMAAALSPGRAAAFQVHFRKLEQIDEGDLLDMLTEAELLRLLSEDEGDEGPEE